MSIHSHSTSPLAVSHRCGPTVKKRVASDLNQRRDEFGLVYSNYLALNFCVLDRVQCAAGTINGIRYVSLLYNLLQPFSISAYVLSVLPRRIR